MVEEILPSLYRIRVPLPRSPLKELNSYVIKAHDRNLIIDTGMNRPECRAAMDEGLADIGIDLKKTDFISTHLHADHHGLIPELLDESRKAYMGRIDAEAMKTPFTWEKSSPMGRYLERSGFPAKELEESFRNHPAFKFRSERRVDYLPLDEGDTVEIGDYCFETIDTPGHTFGHISFYDRKKKVFLAGDHVLGDITPNIQAWSDEHDPLGLFLASLEKVAPLDVDICLPGHRSLIHDFKGRVQELQDHHHERAAEAVAALESGPLNAYETAARMTWSIRAKSWHDFPVMQRWFATGETIAHLRFLEDQGQVARYQAENDKIVYVAR
jgi:glyoxylase-like metal-dependent hydrolase (beta-lactamase superfamily II)